MHLFHTARFRRAYRKLEPRQREQVKKTLTQLLADRGYQGLRVKRVQGTSSIWELRAGRDLRLTFEIEPDAFILRNVGPHDAALQKP